MENSLNLYGIGQEITMVCGVSDIISEYEREVLNRNRIAGLIPVTIEYVDDTVECHYNTSGCISIEQYYQERKMNLPEFRRLMKGIRKILEQMEEYLLSSDGIALSPGLIFVRQADKSPVFCYQLGIRLGVEIEFQVLMDWVLKKIDYSDKELVLTAYGVQSGEIRMEDDWMADAAVRIEEAGVSPEIPEQKTGMKETYPDVVREEPKKSRTSQAILTKLRKWFTVD